MKKKRRATRVGPLQATRIAAFLTLLIHPVVTFAVPEDPYEQVHRNWERLGAVYGRVIEHYYDEVDHDTIMRAAIDGMLRQLDPYSQFFDEEGVRQLRQDTTGKFAGLGITVGIKDHYPVVIAPIEGTPADRAGLRPGDQIVAIEGTSTLGMSLEDVVNALRGEQGTRARITLSRLGLTPDWDAVIEREIIIIRSVAVSDIIRPGIGYISMRQTRFSEDTAQEVEEALRGLISEGAMSLLLDLRGNPGGLLGQAAEVADLFLPKGAPIVSVRERADERHETKVSQSKPVAAELPLVVLIDGGSASAAEIVAGAVQDNDRGVVVGTTSFGKGSVQTIFDLRDREQAALKLTTALYYTPSGRSIHRTGLNASGYLTQIPFGEVNLPASLLFHIILHAPTPEAALDRLRARFDLEESSARTILSTSLEDLVGQRHLADDEPTVEVPPQAYQTRSGRQVLGGGGITPDVVVDTQTPPLFVQDLYRLRVFFDFIVEHMGNGEVTPAESVGTVDEEMMAAFRRYLPRSALADMRRREDERELEALRTRVQESGRDRVVVAAIDSLDAVINRRWSDEISLTDEAELFVRSALQRELVLRLEGHSASLLVELDGDPQVEMALALLEELDSYRELLRSGDD
ncbi:MAG: S41 family peptidase [Candidatus Latescibacterota bacterium]|nr:S41 family peptidase [Candidatus Latescibacterota bacterium]